MRKKQQRKERRKGEEEVKRGSGRREDGQEIFYSSLDSMLLIKARNTYKKPQGLKYL